MSHPRSPEPVKIICGVFCSDLRLWSEIEQFLSYHFGTIDLKTEWWLFTLTRYYEKEMGSPIWRCFLSFRDLVDPEGLADWKHVTNQIEDFHRSNHPEKRRVLNLDPGWLNHQQMVLASCKPAGHRIYLRDGIYAELELWFRHGSFVPLPWTYPDYRMPDTLRFFTRVRNLYLHQRRLWLKDARNRTGD